MTADPARLGKVDFADSVAWLLTELREADAGEAIRTLLTRDPAGHVDLNDPQVIAWLVAGLQLAGDVQAAGCGIPARSRQRLGAGIPASLLKHLRTARDRVEADRPTRRTKGLAPGSPVQVGPKALPAGPGRGVAWAPGGEDHARSDEA